MLFAPTVRVEPSLKAAVKAWTFDFKFELAVYVEVLDDGTVKVAPLSDSVAPVMVKTVSEGTLPIVYDVPAAVGIFVTVELSERVMLKMDCTV